MRVWSLSHMLASKTKASEMQIYIIQNLLCMCYFVVFRHILKPTANWSPYMFTLVQRVKHRVYKFHVFFK